MVYFIYLANIDDISLFYVSEKFPDISTIMLLHLESIYILF